MEKRRRPFSPGPDHREIEFTAEPVEILQSACRAWGVLPSGLERLIYESSPHPVRAYTMHQDEEVELVQLQSHEIPNPPGVRTPKKIGWTDYSLATMSWEEFEAQINRADAENWVKRDRETEKRDVQDALDYEGIL